MPPPPSLHQLLLALGLKDVDRAGWLRVGVPRPESVAAHSWGVAVLAMYLCPPDLDLGRVLALAAVHDLPEVQAGDITPHDGISRAEKLRREAAAADTVFHGRADLRALWQEYADNTSAEAAFVHAVDKLDMALQAMRYAQAGAPTAEFVASARAALAGSPLADVLEGWLADPVPDPA